MNILELREKKKLGHKLSMVTCYDFTSARILSGTAIDLVLVGDSAAMVMHGREDTLPATLEMMEIHIAAVRRGAPKKLIVGDLPFLSYRKSLEDGVESVGRLIRAGAHAVKLEGFDGNKALIERVTQSGVPVMGHVGLTPQFVNAFGGFKVQGRSAEGRLKILEEARGLESAGAFAVVLECIPSDLAAEITSALRIPTIGIGAGPHCDGQVLVWQDLLGLNENFAPRFVRRYAQGAELFQSALEKFHQDVAQGRFPLSQESYE